MEEFLAYFQLIRLKTAGLVPVPMAPPSGSSAKPLALELGNKLTAARASKHANGNINSINNITTKVSCTQMSNMTFAINCIL